MKKLTPAQQAIEHLIISMLISAIGTALLLIIPFISNPNDINWLLVGGLFAVAFLAVLGGRVSAYFRPTQPALADAINALLDVLEKLLEQRYGVQLSELLAALKDFYQQQQQQTLPMQVVKSQNDATVAH